MTVGVITTALQQADSGAVIRLRPGIYVESIAIDRPVEIVGDGQSDEVIIESPPGLPCLRVTSGAIVRGVTLRGQNLPGLPGAYDAIEILSGQPTFEDCTISSSYRGVIARGPASHPIFRRCLIHEAAISMAFENKARALIEDCRFINARFVASIIDDGAEAIFRRSRISNAWQAGVIVRKQATGVLENCELFSNPSEPEAQKRTFNCQILVIGGEARLDGCRIHDGLGCGVYFSADGHGRLTNCRILANDLPGVQVGAGSDAVLKCCHVQGRRAGVAAVDGGRITVDDCDITDNGAAGLSAQNGATFHVQKSRLTGNVVGVAIAGAARGSVHNCDLRGNTRGSSLVEPGCQIDFRENQT